MPSSKPRLSTLYKIFLAVVFLLLGLQFVLVYRHPGEYGLIPVVLYLFVLLLSLFNWLEHRVKGRGALILAAVRVAITWLVVIGVILANERGLRTWLLAHWKLPGGLIIGLIAVAALYGLSQLCKALRIPKDTVEMVAALVIFLMFVGFVLERPDYHSFVDALAGALPLFLLFLSRPDKGRKPPSQEKRPPDTPSKSGDNTRLGSQGQSC